MEAGDTGLAKMRAPTPCDEPRETIMSGRGYVGGARPHGHIAHMEKGMQNGPGRVGGWRCVESGE